MSVQLDSRLHCTDDRHPLKLGGQQWRRREKRKQRRRRPRSVGRRSRRRRCRSSIALEAVEDRVTRAGWRRGCSALCRDDPPGRAGLGERQGASAGTEVWTSSASPKRDRAAADGEDGDEKAFGAALASASGPKSLRHLADALGVLTALETCNDLHAASGVIPRRRFSLPASLRGAKRRSNLEIARQLHGFASRAMT
jgi:hypothetical protein